MSVECRPGCLSSIGRVSAGMSAQCWPRCRWSVGRVVGRVSAEMSVKYRPSYGPKCRSSIGRDLGRVSPRYRPRCRSRFGRDIGRVSAEMSVVYRHVLEIRNIIIILFSITIYSSLTQASIRAGIHTAFIFISIEDTVGYSYGAAVILLTRSPLHAASFRRFFVFLPSSSHPFLSLACTFHLKEAARFPQFKGVRVRPV